MKNTKKFVSLLLILCLSLTFIFVGCTKSDDSLNQNDDNQKDQVADDNSKDDGSDISDDKNSEDEVEPVKLKWLQGGPGKQKDFDRVMELANEKLTEYLPNTTFEMEVVPIADYKQRFDLAMAAEEQFDIAWKCWTQPLMEEVNKGSYLELDELIDKYAPDIREAVPDWNMKGGQVNSKQYVIPRYEMHYWQLAAFIPKEIFEKYFDIDKGKEVINDMKGLNYRHATEELYDVIEDYLQKAKEGGDLRSGFSPWMFNLGPIDLIGGAPSWTYLMPAVVKIYYPGNEWDFTVLNVYEMPETINMFKKLAEWREKGYLREDMLSLQNPREYEKTDIEDGYIMYFHNDSNPENEDYVVEKVGDTERVRLAVEPYALINPNKNDGLAIPRTAESPERAIQVIELLETEKGKEFYNLLTWGIEGEHYNKISENRIETIGYTGQGNAESAYGLYKWALGNVHNAWLTQADPIDNMAEYWDRMHEEGIKSPFGTFLYDNANTVNELAQIRTVLSEYVKAFRSGYYEEAKYNEFLEKLKKAGVDKVIEDVQQQVDKYLEEQGIPKTGYIQN